MEDLKYLEAFKRVTETCGDSFRLTGDCLLVEILSEEIKTKSNLVIAADPSQYKGITAQKPVFCRVLVVGEGFYDTVEDPETGEKVTKEIPLGTEPGDVIVVGQNSAQEFSHFGKLVLADKKLRLALVRESEILVHFLKDEGYDAFFNSLDKELG